MAIKIFSNITSLQVQENLRRSTANINKTYERLSSGLRIISASDDPAGLGVADRLRADARLTNVAIRNINDGISLVDIAQSALGEITNILVRMAELANQSKNGTLSSAQISPIHSEFVQLGSEINRIVQSTKFNNILILSTNQQIAIQAGITSDTDSQIILNQEIIDSERLGIDLNHPSYMEPDVVKDAIEEIGSMQMDNASRLPFALSNAENMFQEFSAAESQIRDADIASESANLAKQQIIQQAGIAVLAQANIQPQIAQRLLPAINDN